MQTIKFQSQQVKFPSACVCCLKTGSQQHKFEQTFVYGRRSFVLQLPVPLCHQHYQQALAQSPAQAWCERLGLVGGVAMGLAIAWSLLRYWSATAQGTLIVNPPLALIIGISFFVLTWAVSKFWLAPRFASAETKAVLKSVRMTRFDPLRQILELTFENDTVAELTARENLQTLVIERAGFQIYHISAHLLDHDIRLSTAIETRVLLDHVPDPKEAEQILQPVIDRILIQQMGEGTFYEVSDVKILAVEDYPA